MPDRPTPPESATGNVSNSPPADAPQPDHQWTPRDVSSFLGLMIASLRDDALQRWRDDPGVRCRLCEPDDLAPWLDLRKVEASYSRARRHIEAVRPDLAAIIPPPHEVRTRYRPGDEAAAMAALMVRLRAALEAPTLASPSGTKADGQAPDPRITKEAHVVSEYRKHPGWVEWSYEQIAEATGVSKTTVHRVVKPIRDKLTEMNRNEMDDTDGFKASDGEMDRWERR